MTDKEYIKNVNRLKEIAEIVKDPGTGLDRIDALIEETGKLVSACYSYTRGLREKVETLNNME